MRRRVVRDLGTLLGVIVILAALVLLGGVFERDTQTKIMDKKRSEIETKQKEKGIEVTNWELLRKTKGTRAKGPTFAPEVLAMRDQPVSLVGFMTPLYEFRAVTEFILLPLPLQCYFCQTPPMREVVLVQMAEDKQTDIVNEPVLFTGKLTLNEGPGTKFFYVLKDAQIGSDIKGLTKKNIGQQHMLEGEAQRKSENGEDKEELLPGQKVPKLEAIPPVLIPSTPDNPAAAPVVNAPPAMAPVVPADPATPAPVPAESPK